MSVGPGPATEEHREEHRGGPLTGDPWPEASNGFEGCGLSCCLEQQGPRADVELPGHRPEGRHISPAGLGLGQPSFLNFVKRTLDWSCDAEVANPVGPLRDWERAGLQVMPLEGACSH